VLFSILVGGNISTSTKQQFRRKTICILHTAQALATSLHQFYWSMEEFAYQFALISLMQIMKVTMNHFGYHRQC
jgi:uncharacterized membrane protein